MPTKAPTASHQVLIRLTKTQADVLSALAYLQDTSATEIVRGQVTVFIDDAAESGRVQRLVRERAEFEAEQAGALKQLRPTRKGSVP